VAQPAREAGRLVEVVRTCIGCRQRSDKTALVRIVAARGATTVVVTPDLRGTLPGRGAHLHPAARCLELATRRKAFGRALRVEGPLDLSALAAIVEDLGPEE
jgi:predicted RNA-binding protein YlxR (DUF448 family)